MTLATPKALALPPNWSNESYKITPKEKPDEETKFLKSNRIVDLKKDQKNQGPNVYTLYVVVGWERLPKKYHQMYESVLVFINRINFLQE